MKKILLLFIFAPLFLVAQRKLHDNTFSDIPKDSSAKVEEELKMAFDHEIEAQNEKKALIFKEALDKRKQVILTESAIIILLTSVTLMQAMKIKKLKKNS